MHSANTDTSKRLQRLVRCLSDGREYSTQGIIRRAHVMAVSAAVAELRENGYDIQCRRKGDVWYYKMVGA